MMVSTRNSIAVWPKVSAQFVLDALLPRRCMCCEQKIGYSDGLCGSCWRKMPFLDMPWCQRLGVPFTHDVGDNAVSPQAIISPPVFNKHRSVAKYSGPARDLVLGLKFLGRRELAKPMGLWMTRSGSDFLSSSSLVIPVPLHWVRLWQRRFNQAADLGAAIAKVAGCEYDPQILVRTRRTRQQVRLTAKERQKNVRSAFKLKAERQNEVAGRQVVLVDDVYTTGSTITACTKTLLAAGAGSVDVLTFAYASPSDSADVISADL
ncbi:MAG: ComF family protein [Roseibium sp.]